MKPITLAETNFLRWAERLEAMAATPNPQGMPDFVEEYRTALPSLIEQHRKAMELLDFALSYWPHCKCGDAACETNEKMAKEAAEMIRAWRGL